MLQVDDLDRVSHPYMSFSQVGDVLPRPTLSKVAQDLQDDDDAPGDELLTGEETDAPIGSVRRGTELTVAVKEDEGSRSSRDTTDGSMSRDSK